MKVVEIYPSNYRDIPKTLRVIAKELEDGDLHDMKYCAIVMLGADGVEIFGLGMEMDPSTLFQMGIQYHIEMLRNGAQASD